jgi:hypothetical protein
MVREPWQHRGSLAEMFVPPPPDAARKTETD